MGQHPGEELAAAVHETTNALTVILGWIERARAAADGRPEAKAALDRAERYARQARDGMRAAIGAAVDAPDPEPAGTFARRVAEDLDVEARRAGVAIDLAVAADTETIELADPRGAWQVVTNLLLNAIAMSPEGARVVLAVRVEEGALCIEVRDDGPGIPLERRDNLFTGGVSDRPGGAGIGLRHAHALAHQAGGELRLGESAGGASFLLSWPRAHHERPARARPRSAPPPSLDGARVLLLEDDAAVVELLELTLGARGAAVTTVRDATALDRTLEEATFDLLLVDLSPLTKLREGVSEDEALAEALDKARRHSPDIGVIVISGSVTVQPRDDIIWVRKPFEPRELVDAIARQRART